MIGPTEGGGNERRPQRLRDGLRRLCPVGKTARRVERARLVEGAGGARVDAEPAGAAVELERRRRLDLDVRDERSEHDPRSEAFRDQQRVLPVEADARARGALAVDVLVRIDEDAILAAERSAEPVELRAELRVVVGPRVARKPSLSRTWLGTWSVVAKRCRNDRARVRQQLFRVAGDFRLGHREAHVGEQAARTSVRDVPLGLGVRLRPRSSDGVEAEFLPQTLEFPCGHAR